MPVNPKTSLHAPASACAITTAITGALLAIALPATAQDAPPLPPIHLAQMQLQIERQMPFGFDEGPETMLFAAGEIGAERVVKAAPYCADAVHETVQWLADGNGGAPNRIVRQQSSRLCRDGEGRTRQEVERGGRKSVYLRDPVSGESWVLDPERKTARRIDLRVRTSERLIERGGPEREAEAGAWREYAERMREWARSAAERAQGAARGTPPPMPPVPATPATPPTPPTPVIISRSDTGEGGQRHVEMRVLRMDGGAEAPVALAMPPAVMLRAQAMAPRGPGAVTPLGSKEIEGVRASGERTTWSIEAGKVGNEKPIQITREVWTSPDLALTVSTRDFDPRSGEVSYRLKNLRRGEPDAALMRVPADFQKPARPAPGASSGRG